MNQQQGGNAGSYGNNAAFIPQPRQEMEYICAGELVRACDITERPS